MSTAPVLDMELRKKDTEALTPTVNLALMFERLAANPDVPVDKLQALMEMQRSIVTDQARVLFSAEMSEAQKAMKAVAADATNPQTRSRYASYEALDRALRPVYTQHGFSLSFDTDDCPTPEHVRVVCYVEHRAGHSRTYKVDMPADGKGAKGGDVMTKTHAVGAAMSYGMRYLLKMIFNVAVGEDDNDGNGAERTVPPAPQGFDAWLGDIIATADSGIGALEKAWKASRADYRTFVNRHYADKWAALKTKAAQVPA